MNSVILTAIIIGAVIGGFLSYLKIRSKSKKEPLDLVRQKAFELFLHAEKQGWVGPEKMEWCVDQLVKLLPTKLQKIVGRHYELWHIEDWLQEIYDEFKVKLQQEIN